ncbi:hypothetical protein GbCGDNIH2_7034 [Granulibacter bethesdensis]|uniref:Uncharacterized protein n=1 Tax=Granulibacter bethesdensis (strain ATCC BAA-1260 / CGDNIH1) TaxID=391165 RepID=A0A286M2W7_GRABC|nr:hypothetical protein GbCGDNIH2_7034 [Granulibacter bethesdensis]APH51155.1 hypothetical protein GbCGDNIH5_7034 [Granulibacter bethesdensis]APH63849.1 hypothetical protein GbCGDNIH1I4_7034 [Granulibacter bethesdensis]ASV62366.1 hypothetical protein GbCGDNIH1_7034 [Granulibacter bethesdensis CGDNIH1]
MCRQSVMIRMPPFVREGCVGINHSVQQKQAWHRDRWGTMTGGHECGSLCFLTSH